MAKGEGDCGSPEQAKVALRYQFAGAEGADKIVLQGANDFSVSFFLSFVFQLCFSAVARKEQHDADADTDEDNLRHGLAQCGATLHLRHQVAHRNVNETR